MMDATGSLKQQYSRLETYRDHYVWRAREAAALTIPSLMPPDSSTGQPWNSKGQYLPEPYQSIGARGVNNLASRMLLSLLPVNAKFFRFAVDEGALEQLGQFKQAETEVQQTLAQIEDQVLDDLEALGLRIKIFEALRQNITAGNALIHLPFGKAPRVFRLDSYVVERDPRGNLLTIITQQSVSPLVLEPRVRAMVGKAGADVGQDESVEVFTICKRVVTGGNTQWKEWQEVKGKKVGGTITHEVNRMPYIALRMYVTDGEAYGRSHVEQYMGDLRALNVLSKAMQEGSAAMAKVVMLVNPDGPTRIRKLAKAVNGEYIPGRAEDVQPLQLNKMADFSVVRQEMLDLKRDLREVFLLNTGDNVGRDRVTQEEIKMQAAELNDALGGIYSLLSADLQMPLVKIILGNMQDEGRAPVLPEEVRPVIVTGLDAIGRGHDLQRLDEFLQGAMQTFGPEVANFINVPIYLQQRATALGIETEELIKSDEQLQEEQRVSKMQQMATDLGPSMIQANPDAAVEVAQQAMQMQQQQVPA